MFQYIFLILSGVLLNAFAQILLKKGMIILGYFEFSTANIFAITIRAASNPYIIAGLICYVISFGLWMLVLSRVEVSFAYPFLSIGYIITAAIGYYYFGETLNIYRILGLCLICIGVMFVAKSY